MNRMNPLTLFLLVSALTAVPAPDAAAGGGVVNLTSCTTIKTSGSYVLGQNLTRTGDCFKVQAKKVTLDLNGLTLTGNGTGAAITDNGSTQEAILVRNGVISNFGVGVNLANTTTARVENLRLIGNAGTGVAVGAGSLMKDCSVTGGMDGIVAGAGSAVTGNNVSGAADAGIDAGAGSTLSGNTVTGGGNTGITAACPSGVLGNTAVDTPAGCTPAVSCANLVLSGAGCTSENNTAP